MPRPWRARLRDFRLVSVLGLLLVSSSGTVSAHEVGGSRFDAPLPLWLLYAGAGVTVAVTAGWLALSAGRGDVTGPQRRFTTIPSSLADRGELAARSVFFLLFVFAIAHGLFGPQVPAENFATVFVWPVWLKGVTLLAALFGSPWRILSPWRTLYDGLRRAEGDDVAVLGAYPPWLGEWPALVGFVLWMGVIENLTVVPRSPRETTLLLAAYSMLMLLGAIAFGDVWLERADALAVLYRLFGRVAPVEIERMPDGGRTILFRYPWRGCTRPVRDLTVVAFVVATVYTVSFDGFTSTPEYQTILFTIRGAAGVGAWAGIPLYFAGFLLFLAAFAAVVGLADAAGGQNDSSRAFLTFAPTVIPIAVAYEVAHNYPYIARNLGQVVTILGTYIVSGPVPVEPLSWLSLPAFWASQVLLVVGGHVVAVVAAHLVTLNRYPVHRRATRAHVPLTALMVGYTVLSLWIISRPVVT